MPRNASFWQVGLLNVALFRTQINSHNLTNLIFMTSTLYNSFGTLLPPYIISYYSSAFTINPTTTTPKCTLHSVLFQFGTAQPFFLPSPAGNVDFGSTLRGFDSDAELFMYPTKCISCYNVFCKQFD